MVIINSMAIADVLASTDADYTFNLTLDWHNCQQISSAYREVYAFETDSFYINICQKGNTYFYSSEAKQSDRSSIFIPAHRLKNKGFEAKNGNVTYLVVLPFNALDVEKPTSVAKAAEAILTIKRNGRLVAVESSLNKYCAHASDAIAFSITEPPLQDYNQIASIRARQDVGSDIFLANSSPELAPEIFASDARFDFYRIGGKLHRLTTCN